MVLTDKEETIENCLDILEHLWEKVQSEYTPGDVLDQIETDLVNLANKVGDGGEDNGW